MSLTLDGSNGIILPVGALTSPSLGSAGAGMYVPSANTLAFVTNSLNRITIDSSGTVTLANNAVVSGSLTFGGTSIPSNTTIATTSTTQTFTNKTLSSPVISGGYANNVVIGASSPAAGAFTTLSSTGNTTLGDASGDTLTINAGTTTFAQGTANGVLYLNGSKVATSGSGLVFDGTNLGVGITSPASYNSAADNLVLGGSGDNGLSIVSGSSSQGSLFFADGTSGGAQQAAGYLIYVHTSDYMAFGTANTERLRIDSAGNVGIGTSSPSGKLDVTGGGIYVSESTNTNSNIFFRENGVTKYIAGYVPSISAFRFSNGASDTLVINNSGNLGIGTSSPATKLDIFTPNGFGQYAAQIQGNDQSSVRLRFTNTGVGARTFELVGGLPGAANGFFSLYDVTAGATRWTVDSSGNLGLGVTPSAWYSTWKAFQLGPVGSASSDSANALWSANEYISTSGFTTYITSQYALRYRQDVGSGIHSWSTAPSGTAGNAISFTTAMTLTSKGLLVGYTSDSSLSGTGNAIFSGNVGIGTSSPGYKLDVFNSEGTSIAVGATTGKIYLYGDNSGTTVGATSTIPLRFATNSTTQMTLDSSGNLGLGVTPDNSYNACLQLKSGITFPATQNASSNANTLDDYEEGTWTPVLQGSGADPTGVTYGSQTGSYTKVGNLVTVNFYFAFSTFTGGSGVAYIGGFPFACKSGSHAEGAVMIEKVSLPSGQTYVVLTPNANASSAGLYSCGSNTVWTGLSIGAEVTSSATFKYITGSVTYLSA